MRIRVHPYGRLVFWLIVGGVTGHFVALAPRGVQWGIVFVALGYFSVLSYRITSHLRETRQLLNMIESYLREREELDGRSHDNG